MEYIENEQKQYRNSIIIEGTVYLKVQLERI